MPVTAGRFELLVRQRLGALTRMLPSARTGDIAAVHQARVATRRLREALPLVLRGSSLRKQTRAVRRLTRALGPVREFAGARDVPRTGVLSLHQVIRQERSRMQVDLRRAIDRMRLDKLTEKLVAAARKRDKQGGRSRSVDSKQLTVARARSVRRAERLRITIENAAAIYLPDRLHDVRIAAKKLRYSLEILRDLSASRAIARILMLKRAQDLLGRIHDLEVLIARTRAIQGSPNAPTLRVSADMDLLVRRLETECRRLHGRYIAMRAPLLAICDHVTSARTSRRRASAA